MREDCFACQEKHVISFGVLEKRKCCTALNEAVCEKKRNKGACPFYKSRDEWERDMIQRHGTIDLNAVVAAYQRTFGG